MLISIFFFNFKIIMCNYYQNLKLYNLYIFLYKIVHFLLNVNNYYVVILNFIIKNNKSNKKY